MDRAEMAFESALACFARSAFDEIKKEFSVYE